jgi:hypothetical protein
MVQFENLKMKTLLVQFDLSVEFLTIIFFNYLVAHFQIASFSNFQIK